MPVDMLQTGHVARMSPFTCMHRMHVAVSLHKLVHMMQIVVHFYIVADKVCMQVHAMRHLNFRSFFPAL